MKFYLCGQWHRQVDQTRIGRQNGLHGSCDFLTEAIPYLQQRGLDVEPNDWQRLENTPCVGDRYWGAFFERDGAAMYRFLESARDFHLRGKWIICRFHFANWPSGSPSSGWETRYRELAESIPQFEHAAVLLGTHPVVCDDLHRFTRHPNIDLCPWGVPTYWQYPPPQPNPYEPGTRNLVFVGRLEVRCERRRLDLFEMIRQRDPKIKIHVISFSVMRPDEVPANVVLHGGMQSGTFNHLLYYADLALDTGVSPNQRCLNCKNYAYLGMGLPVVTHPVPGTELIQSLNHGILVHNFHDNKAYVDAVFAALEHKWAPKDDVIRYMQTNHGWDKAAAVLEKYIRIGQGLGYAREF